MNIVIFTHNLGNWLIPECNGLSQFIQYIGEPCVSVRKFNLTTYPARLIEAKNPRTDLELNPGVEPRLATAVT